MLHAREFAKRGASIGLLARGATALEVARREVEGLGGTALVLPLDVANHHEVQAAALEVEQKLVGYHSDWKECHEFDLLLCVCVEMKAGTIRASDGIERFGVVYGTRRPCIIWLLGTTERLARLLGFCLSKHSLILLIAANNDKSVGFTDSLRSEGFNYAHGIDVHLTTCSVAWVIISHVLF